MEENFRFKSINYTIHSITRQIENDYLDIDPDFKDRKHWKIREQSQFIESILLGIPTQPIWCEEMPNGKFLVIDGSERLRSVIDFLEHRFRLSELRIRHEYHGMNFRELPYHEILNFQDRYQFSIIVVNFDTSPELKSAFFRGLLKDTKNFTPQIVRNFAYRNASAFLKYLVRNSSQTITFLPNNKNNNTANPRSLRTTQSSKIDEAFLYLVLFLWILDETITTGDISPDSNVETLLDLTMGKLERGNFKEGDLVAQIIYCMRHVEKFVGADLIVFCGIKFLYPPNPEGISFAQFLSMFIKARCGKLLHFRPQTFDEMRSILLITNANTLIKMIKDIAND